MLTDAVEQYLALRQRLGYRLQGASRNLRTYARFATAQGDHHVQVATAVAWAEGAPSPSARYLRLRDIAMLARFLRAEDPSHEVPDPLLFRVSKPRPLPYIYSAGEIGQLLAATGRLRSSYPLRRSVYGTLLGLIAATGLRVSEALDLTLDDVLAGGVLHIRKTKFGKSRQVPLHPTAQTALDRYLRLRRSMTVPDEHVFLSASERRIAASTVNYTFGRVLALAGVAPDRVPRPRIHDLRHTFATRALERCALERHAVSRHFVALSTYLGHVEMRSTYWYLSATPGMLTDIAAAAESFMTGETR